MRRWSRCTSTPRTTPTRTPTSRGTPRHEIPTCCRWSTPPRGTVATRSCRLGSARMVLSSRHGRDHLPTGSHQRAEPDLRPGQPRAGRPGGELDELERRAARPARAIGGAQRPAAARSRGRPAARPPHVLGVPKNPRRPDAEAAVKAAAAAAPGWRDLPSTSGRHPAQGRRPARRAVAAADQRRDHAGPVQDGLPGRDRRRLRADRLLALQRALRPADPHRAADRQQPRHLEPHRPPPARGLRLRDHAVQLHRDRRQPADRAGADGQHGGLEALADPAARRAR